MNKAYMLSAAVLLVAGNLGLARANLIPRNPRDHPAPGTTIIRFGRVDAGVYRGSKPHSEADFRFLQSKHIRYILDIRFLPFLTGPEKRMAKQYGISFLTSPMNGSPVSPSEKHVDRILLILRDRRYRGVYFHCDLGRDRTSLIAALYEMYFLGMSKDAAWREMKSYGFKDDWTLRGLKDYFEKHAKPSPELLAAARAENRGDIPPKKSSRMPKR